MRRQHGVRGRTERASARPCICNGHVLTHSIRADLLVIQETKLNEEDVAKYEAKLSELLPGHTFAWSICTRKRGYAGTMAIMKSGKTGGQQTLREFFSLNDGGKESVADSVANQSIVPVIDIKMGLPTLKEEDGETAKEVMGEGRTITVEYDEFYGEWYLGECFRLISSIIL